MTEGESKDIKCQEVVENGSNEKVGNTVGDE